MKALICMLLAGQLCAGQTATTPQTTPQPKAKSPKSRPAEAKKAVGNSDQAPAAEQPPVFENEKVKVLRYELAPGAEMTAEAHKTEQLVIPIGEVTVVEGSQRLRARSGEVQILKRGPGEKLANTGSTVAIVMVVELKEGLDVTAALCGLEGARCDSVLGGDLKGGSWGINTLMKTVTLEIANMEIDPNVTTDELKRLNPVLRVAVTPLKLAEQVGDQEPKMIEQAPGDVTWVPVGDPVTLKNMAVTKATFAMLTFR